MPRGGKREGSGRKLGGGKYGEPTIPMRIPVSLKTKIQAMIKKYEKPKGENDGQ